MKYLGLLLTFGKLSTETRQKVMQLIGLVAELSADPTVQAFLENLPKS